MPRGIQSIPFPLQRGVLGYRVCFHSSTHDELPLKKDGMESLKQFSFLQGTGWPDADILRHHGFGVETVDLSKLGNDPIQQMYSMVVQNKADFFCRGADEIKREQQSRDTLKNLAAEKTMAFYYPAPIFFYTSASNNELASRVMKGLVIAFNDESFLEIWREKFETPLSYAELSTRKIYKLSNPNIKHIDSRFSEFVFNPRM